jgi:predicted alpha-1,2-mannosidase
MTCTTRPFWLFLLVPFLFLFSSCGWFKHKEVVSGFNFSRYVDPFIGTAGHGHTFPGATMPFGMVQLSPDTRIDGSWDGCSGYHLDDKLIYGFSHTHLSGTGCSDFGDILLMPSVGDPSLESKDYASGYSHTTEKASAGYYAVKLANSNIQVELTTTLRTGFHKYIFPKAGLGNVVVDLHHRDKTIESRLNVLDKTHIEGMRRSEGWAKDQHIYFSIEFSKPFKTSLLLADAKEGEGLTIGKDRGGVFSFDVKSNDSVLVKVGISTVSIDGARKNLLSESPDWDFQQVRNAAAAAWDHELGKIEVHSTDQDKLKIFYTALYHTMIQPNLNMDVDSMYRGRDNSIHKAKGFAYYSVFSLWDTFRGAHPLYTIIEQKRTTDFIQTFLAQYKEGGRLPVWELASNETDCMIGYHAVSVIADAAAKGIKGFDRDLALEAMKGSATGKRGGLPAYIDHGYLAVEEEPESVSKTLEYAYDDYCISVMAHLMGRESERKIFQQRALNYRNVYDPASGFMRARKNGCWLQPFDPREVTNNYTEANAWQYTFFVPQDLSGFVSLLGGPEKLEQKLDSLIGASDKTTGREQADITGLIGQYAHGNEPSHHIAYLYNTAGTPWKTQDMVHRILTRFYTSSADGLIGNEDCGQMSAWYVLSAMGFYSVTPGKPQYAIGSPLFPLVKIHLENGKEFTIKANNVSDKNYFVQSMIGSLKNPDPFVLLHADILAGGSLTFQMGETPNRAKQTISSGSLTTEQEVGAGTFVAAPVFVSTSLLFRNNALVSIVENQPALHAGGHPGAIIVYTTDGSIPDPHSKKYTGSFHIEKTTTVKAMAISTEDPSRHSGVTSGTFYKFPNWWTILVKSSCSAQYCGNGEESLIDGIRGDLNWRKGDWMGYQGQNFEAIVDLGKLTTISKLGAGFLQDAGSWILMPRDVDFFLSSDGKTYRHIVTIDHSISEFDETPQIKEFSSPIRKQKARYVKIKAGNYGKLPDSHKGAGGDAFIFIDEITVQ